MGVPFFPSALQHFVESQEARSKTRLACDSCSEQRKMERFRPTKTAPGVPAMRVAGVKKRRIDWDWTKERPSWERPAAVAVVRRMP